MNISCLYSLRFCRYGNNVIKFTCRSTKYFSILQTKCKKRSLTHLYYFMRARVLPQKLFQFTVIVASFACVSWERHFRIVVSPAHVSYEVFNKNCLSTPLSVSQKLKDSP